MYKKFIPLYINQLLELIMPKKKLGEKDLAKGIDFWLKKSKNKKLEDGTLAIFSYKDPSVREAIWAMKFNNNKRATDLFSEILFIYIKAELDRLNINETKSIVLSYAPTSKLRMRENGFEPLKNIAKNLESKFKTFNIEIEVKHDLLKYKRTVKRQSRIKKHEDRSNNIQDSMQSNVNLNRCTCIIFDDLITSGATMKEIKKVLIANGCKRVVGIVLAN